MSKNQSAMKESAPKRSLPSIPTLNEIEHYLKKPPQEQTAQKQKTEEDLIEVNYYSPTSD